MSPGIASVHLPLSSTATMVSRRARDEDTIQITLGDAVDQVSMSLPTHEDIKLFIGQGHQATTSQQATS